MILVLNSTFFGPVLTNSPARRAPDGFSTWHRSLHQRPSCTHSSAQWSSCRSCWSRNSRRCTPAAPCTPACTRSPATSPWSCWSSQRCWSLRHLQCRTLSSRKIVTHKFICTLICSWISKPIELDDRTGYMAALPCSLPYHIKLSGFCGGAH